MKKNRTARLIVLVLFLAIITAIIIAGTFAKYTTTEIATGTATVAKWNFSANGLDSFTRTDGVAISKIADEKLAPGTSGNFSVEVDCTDCEVSVDYKIVISDVKNKPTNLKFYSDSSFTKEITALSSTYTVTGTVAADASTKTITVPIYWKWAYETTNGDATDTSEGESANDMTFSISVVGTQTSPT